MKISDGAVEALGLLSMLVLTSVVDVIATNFLVESRNPRPHNRLKVFNECMARHQLAYLIWYITLVTLADFHSLSQHQIIMTLYWLVQWPAVLTVVLWLGGINSVAGQDRAIVRYQRQHDCESVDCKELSFWAGFRVVLVNVILTAVSLTLALWIVGRPDVNKALTKDTGVCHDSVKEVPNANASPAR